MKGILSTGKSLGADVGAATRYIQGPPGTTFTPSVSPEGVINWTNDGGKENPQSRNIRGPAGYTPKRGVDYWTAEDVERLDAYTKQAQDSAASATSKASEASASASSASASAGSAATSAQNAAQSESNAAGSAQSAAASAESANASQQAAASSASAASASANAAAQSSEKASTSEKNAAQSASEAEISANAADTSAKNAANSASEASSAASTAAAKAAAEAAAEAVAGVENQLSGYVDDAEAAKTAAQAAQKAAEDARDSASEIVGGDFASKIELDNHIANKSNPHGVSAGQVGALPLTGGALNSEATLKLQKYGGKRFLLLDGHSITADITGDSSGGWATNLFKGVCAGSGEFSILGASGGGSGVSSIFLGSWQNQLLALTPDGTATFKGRPYYGSDPLATKAEVDTAANAAVKRAGDTMTGDLTVPNINSVLYAANSNTAYIPNAKSFAASPCARFLWHNKLAFFGQNHGTYKGESIVSNQVSTDGATWVDSTTDLKQLFSGLESNHVTLVDASHVARRFTLQIGSIAYSYPEWIEIATSYLQPFSQFTLDIEVSTDNATWHSVNSVRCNTAEATYYIFTDKGKWNAYNGSQVSYIRFTFTKQTQLTNGVIAIIGIKAFTRRKGAQGEGIEKEYPYSWDADRNMTAKGTFSGTFSGKFTASADSAPATAKVRNTSLHAAETTPTIEGAIAWTYE